MPRELNLTTRLTLIAGGTVAYLGSPSSLGLAILGSGGPAAFFSHPSLIALAAVVAAVLRVGLIPL